MKKIIFFAFIAIIGSTVSAETLETKNYIVKVVSHCEEGEVSCSKYEYIGKNKKSGNSIRLNGESWHTISKDGSPNRFLGYKFTNGNITYYISESGLLEVIRGKEEVLLSEQGNWIDEKQDNDLAEIGIVPGQKYSEAKKILEKSGWIIDVATEEKAAFKEYPEISCGSGIEQVCTVGAHKGSSYIALIIESSASGLLVTGSY